jgi:DNA-directed RNA polymerase specialized sigma24 family protein
MATADKCRGRVLKGKTLPYGTLTMSGGDSVIRQAYYYYGYKNDEDMPALPHIEPDEQVVDPEEELWKKERQKELGKLLDGLDPRLAKILRLRFGFGMARDMSLEEVGDVFGISRERVRQLEARALRLLKHPNRKLWAIVNPEAFAQREFMDKKRGRKRMYEIEMIYQGWMWMQRQLDKGIIPTKRDNVTFWIEHIKETDPQLYWHFHDKVTKRTNDIFANRLRTPVHDGRERFERGAHPHAKPRV